MGSPAQYQISGGRIITTLEMTPFDVTVYKLGDKYLAARSNEFGYANYEVEEIKMNETRSAAFATTSGSMRWLREPLAHFLLIGLALFFVYAALNHGASQAERSYQITLTTDDVRQLQTTFAAQWQRAPSPEEMRGLEEDKVRQEVLYREALMLGLDKDDIIIKRRLAQKMQFLAEDVAASHQPTTAELKAWYVKNSGQIRLTEPVQLPASLLLT